MPVSRRWHAWAANQEVSLMKSNFDPDALLAALPRREVRALEAHIIIRAAKRPLATNASALFEKGAYNGFSDRERNRIAELSNWLAKQGCTERSAICDICRSPARDEHAEHYYDAYTCFSITARCLTIIGPGSYLMNHSIWPHCSGRVVGRSRTREITRPASDQHHSPIPDRN